jgi:hypothetical protein
LFGLSAAFGGKYKTEFKLPGSESQAAVDLLEAKGVSERTASRVRSSSAQRKV